ncbi:unnamed protein product [Cyberlindnera jadinii]|uniref:Uncharacterized protein n=1 Tax=Cyberlindnera jadinii (strain ATCC 18201 / CBS 1600 / BCRC 20928 / JCM 3617 / NBRC 0987 / NRRL Y-1542) TaxID=983966 RepID=A0A0H5C100_CYBJN|nr:unnamed protein product [Cyberlindnera jadinii]
MAKTLAQGRKPGGGRKPGKGKTLAQGRKPGSGRKKIDKVSGPSDGSKISPSTVKNLSVDLQNAQQQGTGHDISMTNSSTIYPGQRQSHYNHHHSNDINTNNRQSTSNSSVASPSQGDSVPMMAATLSTFADNDVVISLRSSQLPPLNAQQLHSSLPQQQQQQQQPQQPQQPQQQHYQTQLRSVTQRTPSQISERMDFRKMFFNNLDADTELVYSRYPRDAK